MTTGADAARRSMSTDSINQIVQNIQSVYTIILALMNMSRVRGIGAPVASIGGAGKFDGVFLTGLVAVLLAAFLSPRQGKAK